jgi:transposase-like protein
MNPHSQFCHNPQGPARGQRGRGNIHVHSRAEQRYRCTSCGQTFAATKDTPFYRLRTAADVVTLILTLLSHGCPTQAIVAAFGFDERTVAAWLTRAGQHCQRVHQHVVQQGRVDLQHVQADELWVKLVRRPVWMGMAIAVPARLWLGGVISPRRDLVLITTLVQMIRSCARSLAILVCVDGLASYVTAFLRVFRHPVQTGRRGRAIAHTETALTAWMWLVGCGYNFCGLHQSLRLTAPPGAPWKWQEHTPAMAVGLTRHRWTMLERLRYQVPLPARVAPKRRGRPPKRALQPVMAVAA